MITVICIKWGNKYSPDYVDKLFRGVQRNTSKEFSFVCFTDNWHNIRENISIQPLPLNVGDWHNKIGLYNKNLYLPDEQIFYFDLDTVITGNLDEIFDYRGNFIILRDFYRKDGFGSGLMSWRPHAVNFMYENYPRGHRCRHGDQGWPEEQYPTADIWQELYPGKIVSYKVHVKKEIRNNPNFTKLPGSLESSSIVCFHGKPNPHEVKHLDWMEEHWI